MVDEATLKLRDDIYSVIHESRAPLQFEAVRAGLRAKRHRSDEMRVVDRALQSLRRQGLIRYQKSTGDKATHGWVTVPGSTDAQGQGGPSSDG